MDISVTAFRARCLQLIRSVEAGKGPVDIRRRGKLVARLSPPPAPGDGARKPWARLVGSGELHAAADESVLTDRDFEATR